MQDTCQLFFQWHFPNYMQTYALIRFAIISVGSLINLFIYVHTKISTAVKTIYY